MRIYILKIKQIFFISTVLFSTFFLLINSQISLISVKNGLKLWSESIIPSIFPFLIASEILCNLNIDYYLNKLFSKFMKKIFNLSGYCAFPLFMGLLCGYPISAKITASLYNENKISKLEAEHLLSFSNIASPNFIIGAIGITIFNNSSIGLFLVIINIISSLIIGIIFNLFYKNKKILSENRISSPRQESTISLIILKSISNSIPTILNIGGFIIFFSVIISIIKNSNILFFIYNPLKNLGISSSVTSSFIYGIFEITNGINSISIIGIKNLKLLVCISSFLIGFSGISVIMQIQSIIFSSKISIKPYIIRKDYARLYYVIFKFIIF